MITRYQKSDRGLWYAMNIICCDYILLGADLLLVAEVERVYIEVRRRGW